MTVMKINFIAIMVPFSLKTFPAKKEKIMPLKKKSQYQQDISS
jgi:hypothetical protein